MSIKTWGVAALAAVVLAGAGSASALTKVHADSDDKERREGKGGGSSLEIKAENPGLEVHITGNGEALVRGAKVTGISGNTLTATTGWGSMNLAWNVETDGGTEFVRRSGGRSAMSEFSVGDIVSFKGDLMSSTASLTVKAKTLKNWSIQKENANFSGTVSSVNSSTMSFVLQTGERGNVSVFVTTSTAIMRGETNVAFDAISVGAKASAKGIWNSSSNRLEAESVKISISKPNPTTIEGKLKSVATSTAPTTLVVTAKDKDYTVKVSSDTSILNWWWLRTSLGSFRPSDTIRVYGVINADATIDATVVRNTSLKFR